MSATAFVQHAIAWFEDHDVHIQTLMTDNGRSYGAHYLRQVLSAHGIQHVFIQAYRPQTNGKAERFIRTAKNECAYARAYPSSAAHTLMRPGS